MRFQISFATQIEFRKIKMEKILIFNIIKIFLNDEGTYSTYFYVFYSYLDRKDVYITSNENHLKCIYT